MKKILVVVAHPDDEVLGFGGSGSRFAQEGDVVKALIVCGQAEKRGQKPSDQKLLADCLEANKDLGFLEPSIGHYPNLSLNLVPHSELVEFIEKEILEFEPNLLFGHSIIDLNNDHEHVARATLAASRIYQRKNSLKGLDGFYQMEIASSTDWSLSAEYGEFRPNYFVDVSGTFELKISALSKYTGVMRPPPHPRSKEVLEGLARYRGGQSGLLLAEGFNCIYSRS